MRIRLVIALVTAASTAAWAQAGAPSSGQPPEAGGAASAGERAGSPASADDPGVGFGGPEPAQEQAERAAQEVQERLQRLEQAAQEQRAATEASQQMLRELDARLAEQDALSATAQQRTIAAEQEQRASNSGARADDIQRALRAINGAQQRVEAGSDDIGDLISSAVSELESAAGDAGRWGSDAEAGHLTEAAHLLSRVPAMVATRNFQNATVALFAAERRAITALALARTVGARR